MTGRFDEAASALGRSIAIEPDNAHAHYNLGLLAARAGRYADAVSHFERANTLDPDDADVAAALAEARAAARRVP